MAYDQKSFLKGLALGLAGKPLEFAPKKEPVIPDVPIEPDVPSEPVAYLYGHVAKEGETPTHTIDGVGYVGAVLPKLPEWDTVAYPYAVIGYFIASVCHLYYAAEPFTTDSLGRIAENSILNGGGNISQYKYTIGDSAWSEEGAYKSTGIEPLWANFALYYGSKHYEYPNGLCIAASDPIPIYE